MKSILMVSMGIALSCHTFASERRSLEDILEIAYKNSPAIQSSEHRANAEESLISSSAAMDDPVIGISTLDRNVKTRYGTISQKIRFPNKYFLQKKAQSKRADSFKSNLDMTRLMVRQEVISLYYSIYSVQKIMGLTRANMQAVKDFARIAEKKYAAGNSTQGDSMKAHLELTQLELDLINLKQEEDSLQEMLKAVVGEDSFESLNLVSLKLPVPDFDTNFITGSDSKLESEMLQKSPKIKAQVSVVKESEYRSKLAKWEYAPDFQVQYQQRLAGEPVDSHIFSVGITIPLWFWKKNSKSSAANSMKMAQEFKLNDVTRRLIAKVRDLSGKVESGKKTLKIYETSLIPQAQGAYNSSRAAYRASKTSFLDLLDSERSLYRVKKGFYKSLRQYIGYVTKLETQLGFTVSDMNFKNEVR